MNRPEIGSASSESKMPRHRPSFRTAVNTILSANRFSSISRKEGPIFRAPVRIRQSRKSDFEPKLVSLGPYFYGDGRLIPMEELKPKFISEFLSALGISQPVDPVPEFLLALGIPQPVDPVPVDPPQPVDPVPDPSRELVGEVRGYYKENVKYSNDDFLEILVRDSLFIIGIILLFQEEVPMTFQDESALEEMNIKGIRSDLLLLENQIPLLFTKKVYDWIIKKVPGYQEGPKFAFDTVVKPFIGFDMPWKFYENHMVGADMKTAAHLLDLYWRCSFSPEIIKRIHKFQQNEKSSSFQAKSYIPVSDSKKAIPNATTLTNMAGIKFKKHSEGTLTNMPGIEFKIMKYFEGTLTKMAGIKFKKHSEGLDVHFSKLGIMQTKGILHMPCLIIDLNQTTILANLIAFENSKSSSERIFHNYIKLMDDLVDSENDVELLQRCGVIYNKLSSHNMAATFFNDIGNYCLVDTNRHLFSDLYKDVQKHYSSKRNQWWASLHHTYFSSPWSRISVGAGAILLILSAAQTFYTIYAYYCPRH